MQGFQVPPADVEKVLLTHPDIMDAGVVGVPDEAAGELPMALVVKKRNSKLTEKDVMDYVAGIYVSTSSRWFPERLIDNFLLNFRKNVLCQTTTWWG